MLKVCDKAFSKNQYMNFYPDFPANYDVTNHLYLPSTQISIS